MMAISTEASKAQFADLELDLSSGELSRQGRVLRLPMQIFLVLSILLKHSGEVVTREELQRKLWTDTNIGDFENGLNKAIAKLRDAFDTLQADSSLIERIPRRGYRFNAKVDWIGPQNGGPHFRSVAVEQTPPAAQLKKAHYWLIGCLTFIPILGAGAWLYGSAVSDWIKGRPVIHSLAVLPMINLSNNPDEDYLADGIAQELITDLSNAKSLRVVSYASTSRFRQSKLPVPKIAEQLTVDAVINGTVLRINDTLRVTVRLIAAKPERQLWAASYERKIGDILTLQNQIAADAIYQIRTQLTPEERMRLNLERRINPEAQEEYLRGRYILHRETKNAGKAVPHLERAIQLDPNFAAAYAALGEAWGMEGVWVPTRPSREAYTKALYYSQMAVSLDPASAEAYASLGQSMMQNRHWKDAEGALRRAIELDPNNLEAIQYLTLLLAEKDRLPEALQLSRDAAFNNPVAVDFQHTYAMTLYLARRYDEAIATSKSVIELSPDRTAAYGNLAYALVEKGRFAEADTAFAKSEFSNPGIQAWLLAREANVPAARQLLKDNPSVVNIPAAAARYLVGERERGLAELDYLANEKWAIKSYRLRVDPIFDPMRNDPRFTAIVKKTGLLDN